MTSFDDIADDRGQPGAIGVSGQGKLSDGGLNFDWLALEREHRCLVVSEGESFSAGGLFVLVPGDQNRRLRVGQQPPSPA